MSLRLLCALCDLCGFIRRNAEELSQGRQLLGILGGGPGAVAHPRYPSSSGMWTVDEKGFPLPVPNTSNASSCRL